MSKLLRYFEPGQTVFITAITYNREQLLLGNEDLLISAFREVFGTESNDIRAWVIMPDHFHAVVDFPNGDAPNAIRRVKLKFGSAYRMRHGLHSATLWQKRYWDHVIRDESDLRNHIDYVHYNPVKHGLSADPFSYEYSSAILYMKNGLYDSDWGRRGLLAFDGNFGK